MCDASLRVFVVGMINWWSSGFLTVVTVHATFLHDQHATSYHFSIHLNQVQITLQTEAAFSPEMSQWTHYPMCMYTHIITESTTTKFSQNVNSSYQHITKYGKRTKQIHKLYEFRIKHSNVTLNLLHADNPENVCNTWLFLRHKINVKSAVHRRWNEFTVLKWMTHTQVTVPHTV